MPIIQQIGRPVPHAALALPLPETLSTLQKIKQFMSRLEGGVTLFTFLSGALIAAIWGVKIGLVAVAAAAAISLAILGMCSKPKLDPAEQLFASEQNDNDIELFPFEDPADQERRMNNLKALRRHVREISARISEQSLHFNNHGGIITYIASRFDGMDFSKLRLHSLHPVRFNRDREGYEIVIRSNTPRGWFRMYVDKEAHFEVVESAENPERMDRVSPFLSPHDLAEARFNSFNLPFEDTTDLMMLIDTESPGIDMTQLQVHSIQKVRYIFDHVHDGRHHEVSIRGYRIEFLTPTGLIRAHVNRIGLIINHVDRARIAEGGW